MKPKTKEQKYVYSLHKKIPKITNTMIEWGKEELFYHHVYTTKKECTCFECGHKWPEKRSLLAEIDGLTCPKCNKQRKIDRTRKRVFKSDDHFKILTTFKGYQVIRFVHIMQRLKVGIPAIYYCDEVIQHWISPTGKRTIIAKLSSGFNSYRNYWYWSGEMQVRSTDAESYYPRSIFYPKQKIIPEIIRNGFTNEYHNLHPSNFFKLILSEPNAETLLKAGQIALFKYCHGSKDIIKKHWPSIKICMRNNYIVKDASMWFDQLRYLEMDGKDLHNAKYVCPKNLDKEHQVYIERERKKREKENIERQIAFIKKETVKYRRKKRKFLGFAIKKDKISIEVLKTVKEFFDEGQEMHHCVYSGRYYDNKDTLILSAKLEKQRLETVEVSLKDFEIKQCRGKYNKNTEYHDTIINLVNSNINKIKQLSKSKV